jgi:hypothetical protein
MHIGDFKAQFSQVVKMIEQGITIKVIKGKAGEVVGYFKKEEEEPKVQTKRPLGILQNENVNISLEDLQWSEEELDEWGL